MEGVGGWGGQTAHQLRIRLAAHAVCAGSQPYQRRATGKRHCLCAPRSPPASAAFIPCRATGCSFVAFNLLAGGLLTDKRAAAAAATGGGQPPADGGRFDPAQAGPMKIGVECALLHADCLLMEPANLPQ